MVVEVLHDVYEDLETVRRSGHYNMFTEIYEGLSEFGYYDTLSWVKENKEQYLTGFKEGIEPKE